MNIVLPFRGEFGLKVYWQVPAVHALPRPKVVYIEQGEHALYPSATEHIEVPRKEDDAKRRNNYVKDADLVDRVEAGARERFGASAKYLRPDAKWPRKRFVPEPHVRQLDSKAPHVVVCPRKRDYGVAKNWPHWLELTKRLVAEGLSVFAGGAPDSSYDVPCPRAWEYALGLDATIEAMHAARLVVATDAGLAHLAVLCGRPLLMITHGAGFVCPGPFIDDTGKQRGNYWPVHVHRYREGNHTGSPFTMLHNAWYDVDMVVRETMARAR